MQPLSEVCSLITDGTHYTPPDIGVGLPFLTVKDIDERGNLDLVTCSKISEAEFAKAASGNSAPNQGDVLFSKDGTVGKVSVVRDRRPFAVLSSIAILRPNPSIVDAEYLGHALRAPDTLDQALRKKTGSAIRRIILSDLKGVRIPVPPLPEQRRIAAILDKADALRAKRRLAIAKLDQLLQSVFLDMFGDPVTNPKGWPEGSIEIVTATSDAVRCGPFGTQLKVDELVAEGVPLWGIENVRTNKFVQAGSKFVTSEKAKQLKAFATRPGDVLVTRMGTIGKACVVPDNAPEGRISYHLFRVRPDPSRCLPEFLASTISRSGTFMRQLERLAHGAIMAGLNTGLLKDVKFLLPPVELQKKFLDRDQAIERQLGLHLEAMDRHDDQFRSLQALAFSGAL